MFSRGMIALALVGALGAVQTAGADESGSFSTIGSYVNNYVKFDHAGGTVVGGSMEGTDTVIESTGGPFSEGAHNLVTCVAYGKISAEGPDFEAPCTVTDASGDRLYTLARRRAGGVEKGGGGEGRLELLGGTGKYAGVTGHCAYAADYLANNRHVLTTDCEWRRSTDRE